MLISFFHIFLLFFPFSLLDQITFQAWKNQYTDIDTHFGLFLSLSLILFLSLCLVFYTSFSLYFPPLSMSIFDSFLFSLSLIFSPSLSLWFLPTKKWVWLRKRFTTIKSKEYSTLLNLWMRRNWFASGEKIEEKNHTSHLKEYIYGILFSFFSFSSFSLSLCILFHFFPFQSFFLFFFTFFAFQSFFLSLLFLLFSLILSLSTVHSLPR